MTGLSGTGLVLRNNAGNDLTVAAAGGSFTFTTALASGTAYNVTVATQPINPSQTCAVTGGSGSVGGANVSTVQVACTTNSFTVRATVTGLDANGLVLQNNGGSDLAVASDGTVTFPGQTISGGAYAVTVSTQPTLPALPFPAQQCSVTNGSGMVGNADVYVAIACAAPVFKYLYVSNQSDLSAYSVNANTGALTPVLGAPFATGPRPGFATPSGRFLYVSNAGDVVTPPRVSGYEVDSATGALTELDASPYDLSVTAQPVGTSFNFVANPFMHRSQAFGYVVGQLTPSAAVRFYGATLNSLTGELTEIPGFPLDMGFVFGGSAYDSGGRVLFVTTHSTLGGAGEIRTFTVNSPSGTLTPVGTFPTSDLSPSSPFVIYGDNFVLSLGRSAGTVEVFAVGKSGGVPNGVLTPVGAPVPTGPPGSQPTFLSFNRRNNVFYVTNSNFGGATSSLATFRLDQSTGALTEIGTPVLTNDTGGSAILHTSGRFLLQARASGFQRFTIDPTTYAPILQPDVTTTESIGAFNIDFSGKYLYTSNRLVNSVSSYRIDAATGAMTLVDTEPAGNQPLSVSAYGFQLQ